MKSKSDAIDEATAKPKPAKKSKPKQAAAKQNAANSSPPAPQAEPEKQPPAETGKDALEASLRDLEAAVNDALKSGNLYEIRKVEAMYRDTLSLLKKQTIPREAERDKIRQGIIKRLTKERGDAFIESDNKTAEIEAAYTPEESRHRKHLNSDLKEF